MGEVLEYRKPEEKPWRRGLGTGGRSVMGLMWVMFGVVLPTVCFCIAWKRNLAGPEYQNGEWFAVVAMVASARCSLAFFPLLGWSMLSIFLVALNRAAAKRVWVRMGLYTGVLLALQYVVIQSWALMQPVDAIRGLEDVGLWVGAAVVFGGAVYMVSRWPVFIGVGAGLWVMAWMWFGQSAIGGVLLGPLVMAPALTLGVFGLAILQTWGVGEWKSRWVLGMSVFWGVAWVAAWRVAFEAAMEQYAALPTTAPNCYVATAAARGHEGVVKGEWVKLGGRWVKVNEQLRRMKCAEIALRAGWPTGHRWLRRGYDAVGRRLARGIRRRWVGDVAYWLLKPVEWGGVWVVGWLADDLEQVTRGVYRGSVKGIKNRSV